MCYTVIYLKKIANSCKSEHIQSYHVNYHNKHDNLSFLINGGYRSASQYFNIFIVLSTYTNYTICRSLVDFSLTNINGFFCIFQNQSFTFQLLFVRFPVSTHLSDRSDILKRVTEEKFPKLIQSHPVICTSEARSRQMTRTVL